MSDNRIDQISQGSVLSTDAAPTSNGGQALTGENINQKEFLSLLVHQLQNQDPLNPMDNQEFAVQLAQFSQVEELMDMNQGIQDLVASNSHGTTSLMASFLGKEVAIGDTKVDIQDGKAPNVLMDIPEGTQSIRIDLIDEHGVGQYSAAIEDFTTGQFVHELNDPEMPDGVFTLRALGVSPTGRFVELNPKFTGTVEGFTMEPDAGLLINGRQYSLDDITEVFQGNG